MEVSGKDEIQLNVNEIIHCSSVNLKIGESFQVDKQIKEIFRQGSTTYFNASRFFPSASKRDVSELYAFVRIADNYVDSIPQDKEGFYRFKNEFELYIKGGETGNRVVKSFVSLMQRKSIPVEYVRSFLNSMEMDITKSTYNSLEELLHYVYGSAEVIGLIMHKILSIEDSASYYAAILGRSMQFLNFIRDVQEDNLLERIYLPIDEMREFGLEDLTEKTAMSNPSGFSRFMRLQLDRFFEWDREARLGFRSIPSRSLVPIKTAQDMYLWTGKKIYRDPMIVFRTKVKPTRVRIVSKVLMNMVGSKV